MTFNELIVAQPWNKANDKRLGKHFSAMSVFHDTWLVHLREAPAYVQEIYDNSPLQKGLEEFINTKLSKYVYRRK